MKETQYFSHNFNARNDGKMVRLLMRKGAEGIGLYWCIIEMLYEENGYLMRTECERIAFELRVSEDSINEVIFDYDLFQFDDEKFWSKSALERISLRNAKADKARQSAEKRWSKSPDDANALRPHSDGNAINKTKGKEIKEKETTQVPVRVFSFLNDFFETYPKQKNQLEAEDAFCSLTDTEKSSMIAKLPEWLAYWKTIEVRYVPSPEKFLSERKWQDPIPAYKKTVPTTTTFPPAETPPEQPTGKEDNPKIWEYFLSLDEEYRAKIEKEATDKFAHLPIRNTDQLIKGQIIINIRPEYEKHKSQ